MNTIIEKIRAEVNRQRTYYNPNNPYGKRAIRVCNNILSFLGNLEKEEKPGEGLEEEFNHYCFDFKDPDTGEDIPKNQISFKVEDALNVARHFAQWGAEHLKK